MSTRVAGVGRGGEREIMTLEEAESIARNIAHDAHAGQFRRDGVTPYVTHPAQVASAVSPEAKPIAWLHDVLEDCPQYSRKRLLHCALSKEIVDAVWLLTKVPGTDYMDYILRVKANPLAREVKIADIEYNLSANPNPESVGKYRKALEILKATTATPLPPAQSTVRSTSNSASSHHTETS